MKTFKTFKVIKTIKNNKSINSIEKEKTMNAYEKMKKAIENLSNEKIEAEMKKIQIEKIKRYEYHKKYNQDKKDYEKKLFELAKKKNLI